MRSGPFFGAGGNSDNFYVKDTRVLWMPVSIWHGWGLRLMSMSVRTVYG